MKGGCGEGEAEAEAGQQEPARLLHPRLWLPEWEWEVVSVHIVTD